MSSHPQHIQDGGVWYEVELLGKRTEARAVLLLPWQREQQQRAGDDMRTGPTHTVSEPPGQNRPRRPVSVRSSLVLYHHGDGELTEAKLTASVHP